MDRYYIGHEAAGRLHDQRRMYTHGIAGTFVVSFSGEADVSGVSLIIFKR